MRDEVSESHQRCDCRGACVSEESPFTFKRPSNDRVQEEMGHGYPPTAIKINPCRGHFFESTNSWQFCGGACINSPIKPLVTGGSIREDRSGGDLRDALVLDAIEEIRGVLRRLEERVRDA